ncbi:MAG: hypothetical protein EOP38_13885 [Rubrivivax sp.]|nr:MAG: hypothetical protein EOP38_13885 [Rubrivivax sp.]
MKAVLKKSCINAGLALVLGGFYSLAAAYSPTPPSHIEKSVEKITAQLKQLCPIADPSSQVAFDQCRQALFKDSFIKRAMNKPVVMWGRQKDASVPLKDTHLTQFAPEILSGLYLPLFMFDGQYKISYNEREKMYFATLSVGFRNRLQPGQFPYPFWHDANKWEMYENARSLYLWLDPITGLIRFAQFSNRGEPAAGHVVNKTTPPAYVEGQWLWTDAQGKTQPAVTLFDGLYREDNPYKQQLDRSYREFATSLRESQCLSCHVPNNPDKMKRLVLLQSPAHASAEIHRVLKAVREQKMPLDEQGVEKLLDPAMEKTLLEKGGAFEKFVDAAVEWERAQK